VDLKLDRAAHAAGFRKRWQATQVRMITLDGAVVGWLQTTTVKPSESSHVWAIGRLSIAQNEGAKALLFIPPRCVGFTVPSDIARFTIVSQILVYDLIESAGYVFVHGVLDFLVASSGGNDLLTEGLADIGRFCQS
jgi:hypothetical protein